MKTVTLLAAAIFALVLTGCGGSIGNSGASPLTGSYRSLFTRGAALNTNLLATIGRDGTTTMTISDGSGVLYKGIGSATNVNTVNVTLTGPGGTVNATGNFIVQGIPTINLTLTGAISAQFSAQKFANVNISPFTGPLSVTYSGDESGSASLTVDQDGKISGTASSPSGGNFSVIGSVDAAGDANFHGNGTVGGTPTEFTWTGDLFFNSTSVIDVMGEGEWTTSGKNGTWTAT